MRCSVKYSVFGSKIQSDGLFLKIINMRSSVNPQQLDSILMHQNAMNHKQWTAYRNILFSRRHFFLFVFRYFTLLIHRHFMKAINRTRQWIILLCWRLVTTLHHVLTIINVVLQEWKITIGYSLILLYKQRISDFSEKKSV